MPSMIIALGSIYVRISNRDRVRELMEATQAAMGAERGCLRYEFAESVVEPGRFILVQQWEDRAAFDRHYGSQAFTDYQAAIGPYLVRTSDLRVHEADTGVAPFDSDAIPAALED